MERSTVRPHSFMETRGATRCVGRSHFGFSVYEDVVSKRSPHNKSLSANADASRQYPIFVVSMESHEYIDQ